MKGNTNASCDQCEGGTSVQEWGGSAGKDWSYKPKSGGIKEIFIIHGGVIHSVAFKHDDSDNASKFGGNGGTRTDKVAIDFPSEFLTGISGSYESDGVKSLKFYTNRTQYGPFGTESGTPFSFRADSGVITGFHGRADSSLNAIGVYVKPTCTVFTIAQMEPHGERDFSFLPPTLGPWGTINGGGKWDDGVFSAVKQVQVHVRRDTAGVGAISAVRFEYQKSVGGEFLSPLHGEPSEDIVNKIEINGPSEFLIGIEGYYGPIEGNGNVDVIRSLTFHTNKGKYGPMGTEIGTYFNSMNSSEGKVVGFHGTSDAYLGAIGVHTEYNILRFNLDP
ncbi:hypothetical protein CDL12_12122 [Handroanthus impetiginosus]|uniref:Jacalin-type lectin domain-containing protein n=1 Tax=Handroanthus impetiginosus TaxID=429701 RepID=A0A2G9HCL1_9LAMI|nr:hypothetical protein CDL12_12122 [Handroanthus impetiginosus]